MADLTEAEAGANLALRAQEPTEVAGSGGKALATVDAQGNLKITDVEAFLEAPIGKTGKTKHRTADSFNRYVNTHKTPGTAIYADIETGEIEAFLDDHAPADGDPGWGRHRAELTVTHSREWNYWVDKDGEWQNQTDFAAFIEEGLPDVISPSGADLLELATSFQAKSGASFSTAVRLGNGETQLTYIEEIQGTAGRSGQMTIPDEVVVALRVYEGLTPQHVTAKFRYRVNGGHLAIRLQFLRIDEVQDEAFRNVLAAVATATDIEPYEGSGRF
jgi:uncharacterized protein YfdQ (DUF2303 family)